MKRLFLLSITLLWMSSCGSSYSGTTEKLSKKTLKGTWEVTDIKFVGEAGLYKAMMFDIADSACFKGSEWVFIPNNGSGKFTLKSSSQCDEASSRIHWSFYEPGDGSYQFQFKYVDEKNKPLDPANRGYRSDIDNLTVSSMQMRVKVSYEGQPFDVVMTFNKVSEDFAL